MSLNTGTKVRELVLEIPNATRTLERLGIDYCCGGGKTLEEACAARNLLADEVLKALLAAEPAATAGRKQQDWRSESLEALAGHIVRNHHAHTREGIKRLEPLLAKVCSVHGHKHPELFRIKATFYLLAQDLSQHMMKEERVLFPYIVQMERAGAARIPAPPSHFGTVKNPVAKMTHEHDSAGESLGEMRQASSGYHLPSDACASYRSLYKALADLEQDLHEHIHLENNLLFPRAIEMERRLKAS